jgi:hypothetical protein
VRFTLPNLARLKNEGRPEKFNSRAARGVEQRAIVSYFLGWTRARTPRIPNGVIAQPDEDEDRCRSACGAVNVEPLVQAGRELRRRWAFALEPTMAFSKVPFGIARGPALFRLSGLGPTAPGLS